MSYSKNIIEFINIIKSPNLMTGEFNYLSIKATLDILYPNIEVHWSIVNASGLDMGVKNSLKETIEILEKFPEKNKDWFPLAALISSFLNESLNNINAEDTFKKIGVSLPLDNSLFQYFAYTRSYLLGTNFLYRLFTPKINSSIQVNIESIEFTQLGFNIRAIGSGSDNKYIQNIQRFFNVDSLKEYLRKIILNDKHADNLWLSRIYFCHIFNEKFDEVTIKSSLKAIGKSWGIVVSQYSGSMLKIDDLREASDEIINLFAVDWLNLPDLKEKIKLPYKDFANILVKDWCCVNQKEKLMFLDGDVRKKIENKFMLCDIITSSPCFKYLYLNELNAGISPSHTEDESPLDINFKI